MSKWLGFFSFAIYCHLLPFCIVILSYFWWLTSLTNWSMVNWMFKCWKPQGSKAIMGVLEKPVTSIYFLNYIKCLKCWYLLKEPPKTKQKMFFASVLWLFTENSFHTFDIALPYFLSHMDNNIDPVCHCLFYVSWRPI